MKLGDLVKFVERHEDGKVCRIYGIVIDEMACNDNKPLYKVRWFDNKDADTWHIPPKEIVDPSTEDLFIISEA
jgi:hypothetical protein